MGSSGFYVTGDSRQQILLTLDVKQQDNFYGNTEAIQYIKQDFLTKLQTNEGQQNKLSKLFYRYQSSQLQDVFMEGRLKAVKRQLRLPNGLNIIIK